MVTTNAESLNLIGILLRYLPKKIAWKMMVDMEEEVGMRTENTSLKDSIRMARLQLQ